MSEDKLKGVYISQEVHKKLKILASKKGLKIKELAEILIQRELDIDRDHHSRNQRDTSRKDEKGGEER